MVFDVAAAALSFVLALALRFDAPSGAFAAYLGAFYWLIPILAVARVAIFVLLSMYQRVWRYASIDELVAVVVGTVFSSIVVYGVMFILFIVDALPLQGFPRSLPFLDTLVFLLLAGAWRFSFRVFGIAREGVVFPSGSVQRALIVGGGLPAISIIRELRHGSGSLHLLPVGVLADDIQSRQKLMSLPVLGGLADLENVVRSQRIEVVLLALPSADGRLLRRLVRVAEAAGAKCLTVPSVAEVAAGRVTMDALRQIDVEDLLRRAPARIDSAAVSASFLGSTILVTGAGGSIGGELARQLSTLAVRRLVLVGRGENSIFETMQSLDVGGGHGLEVRPVILDIRDEGRLAALIRETKPDVVFHAAAHKHVTFMEQYPEEAVATNVFGTQKLLRACLDEKVERFILISTDKAVNPTSVMGATKRIAELLVQRAARQSGLPYASVRFGNVLSSRGSVVPIFRRQLANGGPLRVTDPEVSRYFMTIPEAVQLVLQAAALAKAADVFILDMGDPVKIADLARDLIELHGLEVGRDVDIEFIGLQPGEKLHEELVFPDEQLDRTEHEAILRVHRPAPAPLILDAALTDLMASTLDHDRAGIIRDLRQCVPQYRPSPLHAAS